MVLYSPTETLFQNNAMCQKSTTTYENFHRTCAATGFIEDAIFENISTICKFDQLGVLGILLFLEPVILFTDYGTVNKCASFFASCPFQ